MSTLPGEESSAKIASSWAAIYSLALLAFAMVTAELLPSAMLPLMAEGLNASEGMIGQSVTAAAIMAIAFSLSTSTLAQGRDRRWIMIAFTGLLLISNLVVALAPNVWTMLAARSALGATIGVNWGLMPSIALRLAPHGHVARSLSLIVGGSAISGILAAPTAALLGDLLGWRWVFVGAAVLAAITAAALIVILPPMPADNSKKPINMTETLGLPGLVPGMVAVMLMFGGSQLCFIYQVPFLEDVTGLGAGEVSMVLLIGGISGVLGTLIAARPLDISITGTFTVASAALALALLLLLFGTLVVPTILLAGIYATGRSIIAVGANAWVARSFPDHAEGAGGVLVAFIQVSFMISAMLGGLLIDNAGPRGPLIAAAVILVVAAAYVYTMLKPRRSAKRVARTG